MRKLLLLSVLLASIPTLRYPVLGQGPSVGEKGAVEKPDGKAGGNQAGKTDQNDTKEFPFVVGTEGHQQTEPEKKKTTEKENRTRYVEDQTLWYAEVTAWSTAALVGVGLIASIAAFCTLRAIQRQVDLQEAIMAQWVYVKGWQASLSKRAGPLSNRPKALNIRFDILNESPHPLNMKGTFEFSSAQYSAKQAAVEYVTLLPGHPRGINIEVNIADSEGEEFANGSIRITVRVEIDHVGVLKRKGPLMRIQGHLVCGHDIDTIFENEEIILTAEG